MTADDLRSIRTRLGLTQAELARAIGNESGSGGRRVRRYEKGLIPIPPHVADKVRNLEPEEA